MVESLVPRETRGEGGIRFGLMEGHGKDSANEKAEDSRQGEKLS